MAWTVLQTLHTSLTYSSVNTNIVSEPANKVPLTLHLRIELFLILPFLSHCEYFIILLGPSIEKAGALSVDLRMIPSV